MVTQIVAHRTQQTLSVGDVVSADLPYGTRFGIVRSIDNDAYGVYVELYTVIAENRYSWFGTHFRAEALTPRPDVPRPCVVLNALDRDMATLDADTVSHNREQQERTLFYVNGY